MEKLGFLHDFPNIINEPVSEFTNFVFADGALHLLFSLKNGEPGAVIPTNTGRFFSCFARWTRMLSLVFWFILFYRDQDTAIVSLEGWYLQH